MLHHAYKCVKKIISWQELNGDKKGFLIVNYIHFQTALDVDLVIEIQSLNIIRYKNTPNILKSIRIGPRQGLNQQP